jgi:hypothetical protein
MENKLASSGFFENTMADMRTGRAAVIPARMIEKYSK